MASGVSVHTVLLFSLIVKNEDKAREFSQRAVRFEQVQATINPRVAESGNGADREGITLRTPLVPNLFVSSQTTKGSLRSPNQETAF